MLRTHIIEVDGVSVEIVESAGKGAPVFFCHGNSASAAVFKSIFSSELGEQHRLIAMSFPGHGGSSPAADAEAMYSIPRLGELAANVIRKLNLHSFVLVGHSLGGHALLEASHLLDDALGLVLVSAPPISLETLGDAFRPDPSNGLLFAGALTEADALTLAGCFVKDKESPVVGVLANSIVCTDPAFRPNLLRNIQHGRVRDEWNALLRMNSPVAMLSGEHDQFLHDAYFSKIPSDKLWQGSPVRFKSCGHALHLEDPSSFIQTLSRFMTDIASSQCAALQVQAR